MFRGQHFRPLLIIKSDPMTPLKTFLNLAQAKQDRIIDVALDEFSQHGYLQTSINTIVKRLGIAKGSIFQYFGDKRGLFLFVFNLSLDQVKTFLKGVRDETAGSDLFFRLEKTLTAGVRFINAHPLLYRLYLRILFESGIPKRNELLFAIRHNSHEYLRGLIDDARQSGELREDLDPDIISFILDAILDRFLQAQSIEHLDAGLGLYRIDETGARDWIRHIVHLIQHGISKSAWKEEPQNYG